MENLQVKRNNQFERVDDYNPAVDYSNPIQEKWIHKPIVTKTGDTEDDFILEEKAVLIDSVNLHKSIQEEARTTDLKYLLAQLLRTGDESILNVRPGVYGDFSAFDPGASNSLNPQTYNSVEEALGKLPAELNNLSAETLAKMTDEEILTYISKIRAQSAKEAVNETSTPIVEEKGKTE